MAKTASKPKSAQRLPKSAQPNSKKAQRAPTKAEARPKRIRESAEKRHERFTVIIKKLSKLYPAAQCALNFRNPFELLVATILSAQCTDERVNMVTPELFRQYPNAKQMAKAELPELEELIRSTGFFRQKSKSLLSMASDVAEKFDGEVPKEMESLVTLRGVGRKTANVVMGNAFGNAIGIAVDTHVTRLAGRLALTMSTDPAQIESDLIALTKPSQYVDVSHYLILHGRNICSARKPLCSECVVCPECPSCGMLGSA